MVKFDNGKKGNFEKTEAFLTKSLKFTKVRTAEEVAVECVERLKEATPKDTGQTARSWKSEVVRERHCVRVKISNTNIQNGVSVALLIEFGHGTKNGTWVEGKEYIEPVVLASYLKILNETWKEITRL